MTAWNETEMRPSWISLFAGLAGVVASVGCNHLPLSAAYPGPKQRPPEFVERYQFAQLPELTLTNGAPQDREEYLVRRITVQMENKFADHLRINFYEQKADGKFPLLVLSTILSDPNDALARLCALYFARNGYNCAIITRGANKLDVNVPLGDLEEWQRAMLRDYAAAKKVLTREPKVDAARMGTFGFSYGALNNTVLAGTDDSYQAHIIGLAGGPLYEVLARSHELQVRLFMLEYCRKHNCTPEQFIEQWKRLDADPLKLAPHIDARKVLLVLSRFDWIVPYDNGCKLRHAMGDPETLVLFAGHYTAIPYLAYVLPQSLKFFDRRLGVARGPSRTATTPSQEK